MKQSEIQPCKLCGKGVCQDNMPIFYKVRIAWMGLDVEAVKRQSGLEMMLGGAAPLAAVMGPNEDIAKQISTSDMLVCQECMLSMSPGALLAATEGDNEDATGTEADNHGGL